MLSDWGIRNLINHQRIIVRPTPNPRDIQPCSLDVHLGGHGLEWRDDLPHDFVIDATQDIASAMIQVVIPSYQDGGYILPSCGFLLAELEEEISLTPKFAGIIHGKSSIGRLGLFVHITAGLLDPGWYGKATLELFNGSPYPLRIWHGMSIAQITFEELSMASVEPYGHHNRLNHYQGDTGVVPSRYGIYRYGKEQ